MRVALTKSSLLVGFATMLAIPVLAAGAQNPHDSTSALLTSGAGGVFSKDTTCSQFHILPPSPSICSQTPPPTLTATGDVNPGISAHANAHFDGASDTPITAFGFSTYYRTFTFAGPDAGNVTSIVFTSQINGTATISNPSTETGLAVDITGTIQWGTITGGNFDDPSDGGTFEYLRTNDVSPTPDFSGSSSVQLTVDASDLSGATTFYYQVIASSEINVSDAEPLATGDISIIDPTVEFFDGSTQLASQRTVGCGSQVCYNVGPAAVSATPEPASLTLLGTGLIGLAGFAKRKRSAAKA